MKPFKKIAIATLAASVAGTSLTSVLPAAAEEAAKGNGGYYTQTADAGRYAHREERGGRHGGRKHAKRLFERFDVDNDGAITKTEIEEVRIKDFTSADSDQSGSISLDEFKAEFMDRSKDRMIRAFQFADRDGNGSVTQEEADKIANRVFARLDRDENGVVEQKRGRGGHKNSSVESQDTPRKNADHQARRGGKGPKGHMFVGLFDSDGDGKVTHEEFDTKRGELFALADVNGSGSFTQETFGALWIGLNEARLVDMFQRADADGDLSVTPEEHSTRLNKMIERADSNGDGVITKADFRRGKNRSGKGWGWRSNQRG